MIRTEGIILKNVKYGETSIIVTIFTLEKGKIHFIVKGVRQTRKKINPNLYAVGQWVELSYIHREHRNMQYITDCTLSSTTDHTADIVRQCIYLFCIEVVTQLTLDQQPNPTLFTFLRDARRLILDRDTASLANFPIHFLISVADINGYSMLNDYDESIRPYFDIYNGRFAPTLHGQQALLSPHLYYMLHKMLESSDYNTIAHMPLHHLERRAIIETLLQFFEVHSPNFKPLKSLPVMIAVLS